MAADEQTKKPPESSPPPVPAPPGATPASTAEWAASLQAYYANAAAAAAAAGHPYVWPTQHMMAAGPYGTAIPFPPPAAMYHPGAYYAHPSMAAGMVYPAATVEVASDGKNNGGKNGESPQKSGDGAAVKGGSAAPSGDDASRSGDSGSEESSDTRDGDDAEQKDSSTSKRRKSGGTHTGGEPSQAVVPYAIVESQYPMKGRSKSKLPVSAPGRAALPSAMPNLNVGIDLWCSPQALAVPSNVGQSEVSAGLAVARRDGAMSQQQLDERQLKRERRKQSNRESARRSRLRKQQECEELGRKVTDLTTENSALKTELDQLKKACEDMEVENSRLMEEMVESQGASSLSNLGLQADLSKSHTTYNNNGQLFGHTNNSNGKFVSGSHNPES